MEKSLHPGKWFTGRNMLDSGALKKNVSVYCVYIYILIYKHVRIVGMRIVETKCKSTCESKLFPLPINESRMDQGLTIQLGRDGHRHTKLMPMHYHDMSSQPNASIFR